MIFWTSGLNNIWAVIKRRGPLNDNTSLANLVPRVLSYPSLKSERERDPGWVWSRGPRTKLILREESFVPQIFSPFSQ